MIKTTRFWFTVLAILLILRQIPDALLVNLGAQECARELLDRQFSITKLVEEWTPLSDSSPCSSASHLFQYAMFWDNRNVRAQEWMGTVDLLRQRYSEAYANLQSVLSETPNNLVAEFKVGMILYKASDPNDAVMLWRRLGSERAFTTVGLVARQDGQLDRAEYYHRLAIRIAPESPDTHFELAEDLYALGKYDDALIQYQLGFANASQARHTNLGEVGYHQAIILSSYGRYTEAITALQKAIEWHPGYPFYLVALSQNYALLGDNLLAEHWLDEAVNRSPDNGIFYWEYGNYYMQRKLYAEAVAKYEEAVQRDPNNATYRQSLDAARTELGVGK